LDVRFDVPRRLARGLRAGEAGKVLTADALVGPGQSETAAVAARAAGVVTVAPAARAAKLRPASQLVLLGLRQVRVDDVLIRTDVRVRVEYPVAVLSHFFAPVRYRDG